MPTRLDPERLRLKPEHEAQLARQSWKVFGILAEFVTAYERLITIPPAVSVFGSASIRPGPPPVTTAKPASLSLRPTCSPSR